MTASGELWPRLEAIVQASQYLTLATTDENGRPWGSPVWFATDDCREFYWVSRPNARHSQNIAARSEVMFTIFDSHQAAGTGTGAYVCAHAALVPDSDIDAGIAVFSAAARRAGIPEWTRTDVEAPNQHRLYRAIADEHFVLDDHDERIPVAAPG